MKAFIFTPSALQIHTQHNSNLISLNKFSINVNVEVYEVVCHGNVKPIAGALVNIKCCAEARRCIIENNLNKFNVTCVHVLHNEST